MHTPTYVAYLITHTHTIYPLLDATNEYVAGQDHHEALSGVYPRGLQAVTVLIGVFDVVTKLPILGRLLENGRLYV